MSTENKPKLYLKFILEALNLKLEDISVISIDNKTVNVIDDLIERHFFLGVHTDTRLKIQDALFVPLSGENFNGHKFIPQSIECGCIGALVDKNEFKSLEKEITTELKNNSELKSFILIQVDNVLNSLQKLANAHRKKLNPKVLALTGSNGKSSTKEFAGKIIGEYKRVLVPQSSYNNHIGVPLTLLELNDNHDVVICEMGMNHSGEISDLVRIADPDGVLVTMVGRSHLEGLGSIEAIAQAKEEIYKESRKESLKIFNLDNEWTLRMKKKWFTSGCLTFSQFKAEADIYFKESIATLTDITISGHIKNIPSQVTVPVIGRHQLTNLMAASGLALLAGVGPEQIWKALPKCRSFWGRGELLELPNGTKVIFDGYNANPESMKALLDHISRVRFDGLKGCVFSDMLELGEGSHDLHRELGELVAHSKMDFVCFMGAFAEAFEEGLRLGKFNNKSIISDSYKDSLAIEVQSMLEPHSLVLIKGSRGARLERVLETWGIKHSK